MAHQNQIDGDGWVDDRLAALAPPDQWQPDASARLEGVRARRAAGQVRRRRWTGAAVAAVAVCVVLPGTRAFGARCVEACVNLTTRVTQIWRADEPEATAPRVTGARIGDIAPEFVGTDGHGAPVRLSSLRGHVVILNFWATWCGPCKAEIPVLNDLQARFGAKGLDVIGVSLDDEGWAAVTPFASQLNVSYAMTVGGNDVADAYGGVAALPSTFIIDRTGRIVVKREGPIVQGAYDEAIARLLGR